MVGAGSDLWRGNRSSPIPACGILPIFALVENGWMVDMSETVTQGDSIRLRRSHFSSGESIVSIVKCEPWQEKDLMKRRGEERSVSECCGS